MHTLFGAVGDLRMRGHSQRANRACLQLQLDFLRHVDYAAAEMPPHRLATVLAPGDPPAPAQGCQCACLLAIHCVSYRGSDNPRPCPAAAAWFGDAMAEDLDVQIGLVALLITRGAPLGTAVTASRSRRALAANALARRQTQLLTADDVLGGDSEVRRASSAAC